MKIQRDILGLTSYILGAIANLIVSFQHFPEFQRLQGKATFSRNVNIPSILPPSVSRQELRLSNSTHGVDSFADEKKLCYGGMLIFCYFDLIKTNARLNPKV